MSATDRVKLTPKEPQRSWNPTGKWPNLTYRRRKNHDVTIDAKHGLWTSQRAVRQPDTQQKGSSQLSFVWGMNVTQFSGCIASNGFSGSDYSGGESTFHSVADLDRQDVMSKHLVPPQRLELFQNNSRGAIVNLSGMEMTPQHVDNTYQNVGGGK